MIRVLFIIFLLLPGFAFAQAANPQEQIERTIGSLFVQNTNLAAQLQTLQSRTATLTEDLAKALARVKELEEKSGNAAEPAK